MYFLDRLITEFDSALRTMAAVSAARRPSPAANLAESEMDAKDRRHSAGLMRVNHVGEVCAQALYQAQARFARNDAVRAKFIEAGHEEEDHLAWTAQRLRELGSRPSLLNPLWYAGSYALGSVAAALGDPRSLGFVVETERQVEAHLNKHMGSLPAKDMKSLAIVAQMSVDEATHGATAQSMGAQPVPPLVRQSMRAMAKVMTTTAYYL
ncbi:2-polyprenyl-3-methyl-6-methoxy-1,4-benzoquinone monooxygenase [Oxalicibacterium solurbis]|uniref:3-demethoxyubiquinol 3-hydroxylase n=1 Tax=Oxalicibacterium solurbis TaxID=69280 RepID=A0A8J3B1J5_9BURK|nr:2-polyprenyl-3-methyl-6-methoxy-1,4-benzoquinone monooxygenase [Oxalicibacterium solurbis]GGI55386.1 2-nonaprenyl-3-methyl-6-methoxy-1,4-benzoquinol hydroxylase [Oxalicibacterium solurbis]